MRTRRLGLVAASVCSLVIGIGSAAWACVPGHDHTSAEDNDHAAHAAAQAGAAPDAPVAPVTEQPATQQSSTVTTFAPVTQAPAASAPATATASRTATQAPAVRTPAPTAAATPGPAAATPDPTAASASPAPAPAPAPAVAPAATPTTWAETVYAQVPAASEEESSGGFVVGALVVGVGLALLALSAGAGLIRWRRNVRPVTPTVLTD